MIGWGWVVAAFYAGAALGFYLAAPARHQRPGRTTMTADLRQGDALDVLQDLPDGAARCCITSPPYWGLRDYGVDGQLGLEFTPEEYVERLVGIFREVRRVLADDGTLWLNLGDSYVASAPGNGVNGVGGTSGLHGVISDKYRATLAAGHGTKRSTTVAGLKPKNW